MQTKPEFRKSERFCHQYIVKLGEDLTLSPYYAVSHNLSETGMYFKFNGIPSDCPAHEEPVQAGGWGCDSTVGAIIGAITGTGMRAGFGKAQLTEEGAK